RLDASCLRAAPTVAEYASNSFALTNKEASFKNSVLKIPGSTINTLIPKEPTSLAKASLSPSTANLLAEYTPHDCAPVKPASELRFTMTPDCCWRNTGSVC